MEREQFQQRLTLLNRGTIILLAAAFIASFFLPEVVSQNLNEQMVGWLQGVLGTIVIFQIASGEKQNDYYFPKQEKEPD